MQKNFQEIAPAKLYFLLLKPSKKAHSLYVFLKCRILGKGQRHPDVTVLCLLLCTLPMPNSLFVTAPEC